MKEILEKTFKENNFEINGEKIDKFNDFFNLLLKFNENINLTRITSPEDAAKKHFLDSVYASNYIPQNSKIVDVGAGGGFPSIPLKIYRPDLDLTMLDSVGKKVDFLNECVNQLALKNCRAIHARVEDFAREKDHRENFDVCVSRAVASLNTLLEYCLPLVKPNGLFIAFKGSNALEELAEAKKALTKLGGTLEQTVEYSVVPDVKNYLLIFRKNGRTPNQFPRRNNLPRKQPL